MRLTGFHLAFLVVGFAGGLMVGDFGPLFHRHDPRIDSLTRERDSLQSVMAVERMQFREALASEQARTASFRQYASSLRTSVRQLGDATVAVVYDTTIVADSALTLLRPMVIALRDSVEVLEQARDSVEVSLGRQIVTLTLRVTQLENYGAELDRRLGEALAGWKQASRRCRLATVGVGGSVGTSGAGGSVNLNLVSCALF